MEKRGGGVFEDRGWYLNAHYELLTQLCKYKLQTHVEKKYTSQLTNLKLRNKKNQLPVTNWNLKNKKFHSELLTARLIF